MKVILVLVLLVIATVAFFYLGWSFYDWIDSYERAGVKMSFGEFQRIYELAPSKWDRSFSYTYHRTEWAPQYDSRGNFCEGYISTEIAMETLFDFWRLLLWQNKIDWKNKREERLKKEKDSLKTLSIMIEKDADDIRKKWEEEERKAEMLRQEIIDRLGGKE